MKQDFKAPKITNGGKSRRVNSQGLCLVGEWTVCGRREDRQDALIFFFSSSISACFRGLVINWITFWFRKASSLSFLLLELVSTTILDLDRMFSGSSSKFSRKENPSMSGMLRSRKMMSGGASPLSMRSQFSASSADRYRTSSSENL